MKFQDILANALQLSSDDRQRLVESLIESLKGWEVRESAAEYWASKDALQKGLLDVKSVTVTLPDELAKQAQAAGLLGEKSLAELLSRALREQRHDKAPTHAPAPKRGLVRRSGRLVAESLPGEQPISDREVRELIDKMEW